jgi:hypothetical protein
MIELGYNKFYRLKYNPENATYYLISRRPDIGFTSSMFFFDHNRIVLKNRRIYWSYLTKTHRTKSLRESAWLHKHTFKTSVRFFPNLEHCNIPLLSFRELCITCLTRNPRYRIRPRQCKNVDRTKGNGNKIAVAVENKVNAAITKSMHSLIYKAWKDGIDRHDPRIIDIHRMTMSTLGPRKYSQCGRQKMNDLVRRFGNNSRKITAWDIYCWFFDIPPRALKIQLPKGLRYHIVLNLHEIEDIISNHTSTPNKTEAEVCSYTRGRVFLDIKTIRKMAKMLRKLQPNFSLTKQNSKRSIARYAMCHLQDNDNSHIVDHLNNTLRVYKMHQLTRQVTTSNLGSEVEAFVHWVRKIVGDMCYC